MIGRVVQLVLLAFLVAPVGCMSAQHLVFFTNTTIGVDIGSKPATGDPVRFVLGYKRQEGVVDPMMTGYEKFDITMPADATKPDGVIVGTDGVLVPGAVAATAHSVIAKLNFGAGGGGGDASVAQWFATGEAARVLASQPGIAAAVSGRERVEVVGKGVTLASGVGANLSTIHTLYTSVKALLAAPGDMDAASQSRGHAILARLDALDSGAFRDDDFPRWRMPVKGTVDLASRYPLPTGALDFENVVHYLNDLDEALNRAGVVLGTSDMKDDAKVQSSQANQALADADRKKIVDEQGKLRARHTNLLERVESDPAVPELVDFWTEHVLGAAGGN